MDSPQIDEFGNTSFKKQPSVSENFNFESQTNPISTLTSTIDQNLKTLDSIKNSTPIPQPKNFQNTKISNWTFENVSNYLKYNKFDKFISTFESECIDGQALLLINLEILDKNFSNVKLGDRLKLANAIRKLSNDEINIRNVEESVKAKIYSNKQPKFRKRNNHSKSKLKIYKSKYNFNQYTSSDEKEINSIKTTTSKSSNWSNNYLSTSHDDYTLHTQKASSLSSNRGRSKDNNKMDRATEDKDLADLEFKLSGYAEEGIKLFVALLYCNTAMLISSLTMVYTSERVPDSKKFPPLPDIVLDNLPLIPWAFNIAECCLILLYGICIIILLFHKYRVIVLRRLLAIGGSVFLLRSLTIFVTSLSVPNDKHDCIPLELPTDPITKKISWQTRFNLAFVTFRGAGLTVFDVKTCGDYMFSGHTAALTLLQLAITEYGPKWRWLHAISLIAMVFGAFFILAAREHYTLDVLMAFYITSRMFIYYTQLADTGPINWRNKKTSFMSFPLFWFFEGNIPGPVPNIYEHPKFILIRFYNSIKKSFWRKEYLKKKDKNL